MQTHGGGPVEENFIYHHRDHIGSIVAKSFGTAEATTDIEWLANEPWGDRLQESSNVDTTWKSALAGNDYVPLGTARGFTDHEHLDGVGLIHMNGRVYDPTLGRFMSPDPFVQAPYNTQSYNRYSYVFNNPLSLVDPTGYRCETIPDPDGSGSITRCSQGGFDDNFDFGITDLFDTVYFRQQEEGLNAYDATISIFTEGTIYQDPSLLNDFVGIFAITTDDVVGDSATEVVSKIATKKLKKGKSFFDKIKEKIKGKEKGKGPSNNDKVDSDKLEPKAGAEGGDGAGKGFPEKVKEQAREESNNTCVFCGTKTTREPGPTRSEIDHSIPKSRNGNNTIDNAQNTCRTCNRQKGAKTTEEFIESLRK